MYKRALGLVFILTLAATPNRSAAHEGIQIGHSPVDPDGRGPCPTTDPLKLFLLPDDRVGDAFSEGAFSEGESAPANPGAPSTLEHIAIGALLARPEFGGFSYVASLPAFAYISPDNPCHAMTVAFTGGKPFTVFVQRLYWPEETHVTLADPFGLPVLLEDGDSWTIGDENSGHVHPLWLARRAGTYYIGNRITSDFFEASDPFSLTIATDPDCAAATVFDMQSLFNADVVDSDAFDEPAAFDGAGHYWLLNGHFGSEAGLPLDGKLDVFQLGGADGVGLFGDEWNCLLDDGSLSSEADIDLATARQSGQYESIEMLLGAAGSFTSADALVVRLNYATGGPQVVTIRRAVNSPKYFPIRDWYVEEDSIPQLSVGLSGSRSGGGFVRSDGGGIDDSVSPVNAFYFQRVTFPADPSRDLQSIAIDDYSGAGLVGVFAMTGMARRLDGTGDGDEDGEVDLADYAEAAMCAGGADVPLTNKHCFRYELDCDGDVDLIDFARFQALFTGAEP